MENKSTYSTKVGLRGMQYYAYHGYYEWERRIGNTYIVDVQADLSMSGHPDDQLERTLNYEDIHHTVAEHMGRQYKLLETLAYDIATELKSKDNRANSVSVTIKKKNPPLGGKVDHSEVIITL